MTVQQFASLVAEKEGKKKEVSIGNIREILKVANELTKGKLYAAIHEIEDGLN